MKLTVFFKSPCWSACVSIVVLMTGFAARAADPPSTPAAPEVERSIEAIVAEALERNPEVKFYEAEIAAARAGRRSAGSLGNPELSVGIGQKSVRGGGLSEEGVAWSASLMQPFEWPGRVGLR